LEDNESESLKYNISISGNADTATNAVNAQKVYINNSAGNGEFPLIFTNIARCGSKDYDTLYVDTQNDLKYNPSTNTLTATKFNGVATKTQFFDQS
jgi:hypothetical protein